MKCKWVYKVNVGANLEDKLRYKASLMAKEFA